MLTVVAAPPLLVVAVMFAAEIGWLIEPSTPGK
jgi:hypothetical protein